MMAGLALPLMPMLPLMLLAALFLTLTLCKASCNVRAAVALMCSAALSGWFATAPNHANAKSVKKKSNLEEANTNLDATSAPSTRVKMSRCSLRERNSGAVGAEGSEGEGSAAMPAEGEVASDAEEAPGELPSAPTSPPWDREPLRERPPTSCAEAARPRSGLSEEEVTAAEVDDEVGPPPGSGSPFGPHRGRSMHSTRKLRKSSS
jgi:hypothetical protein